MQNYSRKIRLVLSVATLGMLAGCSTVYYKAMEDLGYEKRDILVSRVEDERDDQTAAKKQFTSTLDQLKQLTNFNGGDLEAEYNKLNSSYNDCESRAEAVSKKITSVDNVANAMFAEWTKELDDYHDANLRASSEQKLNDSKARYAELLAAMRNSESKMKPVLDAFHDQVLTLKHDLNAAAISSLSATTASISTDVQNLIQDMDKSINESNAFIDNMKKT